MDHSAMVYLMDAEGRFTDTIAYGTPEPERLAALRRLISGTQSLSIHHCRPSRRPGDNHAGR